MASIEIFTGHVMCLTHWRPEPCPFHCPEHGHYNPVFPGCPRCHLEHTYDQSSCADAQTPDSVVLPALTD